MALGNSGTRQCDIDILLKQLESTGGTDYQEYEHTEHDTSAVALQKNHWRLRLVTPDA